MAGDLSPAGNLSGYVDRLVLGTRHIWQATRVYDPEGMLSTLPAIATTLLGRAGRPLAARRAIGPGLARRRGIAGGLAVGGLAATALGWLWGLSFPVNKPLWTSSYALLMAGLAALALAACHWSDRGARPARLGRPFAVLGVHALPLFFLSSLMASSCSSSGRARAARGSRRGSSTTSSRPGPPPVNASLAYALAYVLLWWALMWALDRSGLRLRV